MELQRAQRNLKFLQDGDSIHVTDHVNLNGESQKTCSLNIETQVPEAQFSLSSDDDSMSKQENKVTTHESSVAKEIIRKDIEINNDTNTIKSDPNGTFQPDLGDTKILGENIFINTQIQSRLDDADEETNLKSKLQQFKYAFKDNGSCDSLDNTNIAAKRRPARRKTSAKQKPKAKSTRDPKIIKNITDFNINNYERSRTVSLLKQLSGKHKKVLDMIKTQNEGNNSKLFKARISKGGVAIFDTYSKQEWKHIMTLLLQKFPHSEETDLNEVQKFLYGTEHDLISVDNQETSQQKLWTASQLPPELPVQSIQLEQETRIRNTQSAVNFLSLSQVMDDKSEIIKDEESIIASEEFSASQEYGNKLEIQETLENIPGKSIELTVGTRVNGFSLTELTACKHVSAKVDTRCENSKDNDHEDVSVVSDTTDEASVFALDPYRYVFIENEDKPALTTDTIGSTQFFTPNTSPLDGIIDLTQESFKAVGSLISPLKVENNEKTVVSQLSNPVQVPATRNPTIIPQKNLTTPLKEEQEKIDAESPIRVKLLQEKVSELEPELVLCSCHKVEVNDSEGEEIELDDQLCIAYIQPAYLPKTSTTVSKPNSATGNNIHDAPVASSTTSPEKSCEILMSQSMKELRQKSKTVGLKPMKTKVEIIQSLQTASQVLSVATLDKNDVHDEAASFTKMEIFDHLTELIQSSADFLERIYTFEPIPLNELIEKLFSVEPFVSQIDEMTIREWADIQGICLRNDKK